MAHGIGARRLKVVAGLATLTIGMLGGTLALFEPAAHASDNLDCPVGTVQYKVDSNPITGLSDGQSASFTVNGQTFTFTKVVGTSPFENDSFDFTSTIAVRVAYVKGGVDTNVYDFVPPSMVGTGLHPPLNSGHQPPTISHVTFCVSSDATTTTAASSTTTIPVTSTTGWATTTTVPVTSTTVADSTTTTTVPETSTTVADTTTSTTVPETSTTVADSTTTTTVPETTTTVADTTTTVPETTTTVVDQGTTTTVPETTTTVGDTTTTLPGTTTTVTVVNQGTTVASSTTVPKSTTTVVEQGAGIPTSTTTVAATDLPFTGSNSSGAAMFGLSCMAAGALLLIRKRRNWSAS